MGSQREKGGAFMREKDFGSVDQLNQLRAGVCYRSGPFWVPDELVSLRGPHYFEHCVLSLGVELLHEEGNEVVALK